MAETTADAAQEVSSAIRSFTEDLTVFRSAIEEKFQKQDERMTRLDRKTLAMASRPNLALPANTGAPHQKAFEDYLRTGDDDGLRGLGLDAKGLSTAVAAEGGYLVDPVTSETVRLSLSSTASLRAVSSVVHVEATSFDVLVDHTDAGAGWSNETGPVLETDTPQIDRISIPLHELSALPKASQRLLDDSAFDIDNWLADRIARKFARSEAAAFIIGDGIDKPMGLLSYPTVDNDVWQWGNIGYVPTGVDGAIGDAEALLTLVYSLGAEYRASGQFVMNSKTAGSLRKLKDNDGRFLWSDSLSSGEPAKLLGFPVLICEDMPDITTDSFAIAFGDFRSGYTIAERPDLRVLRDPFSAKPHVLFYATKRVGGAVSDYAAIKLLKFGTA